MGYQTVVLPEAERDLERLAPTIRNTIVRRVAWLATNAEVVIHHPLKGMPSDLVGLCRLRVGDYRVLYWKSDTTKIIHLFRVRHRSEIYERL